MNKKREFFEAVELGLGLGLSISLPIAGGALLGKWLDEQTDSYPRWTLNFLFLGFFMAIAALYQQVKKFRSK